MVVVREGECLAGFESAWENLISGSFLLVVGFELNSLAFHWVFKIRYFSDFLRKDKDQLKHDIWRLDLKRAFLILPGLFND